jgi:tRNA(fMet)-specific endonuclease VapC
MKYLVDSDWVADYLKGRQQAVDLIARLGEEGLAISMITFGEIYEGIFYGGNPRENERGFLQFLRFVDVLPLNRLVMKRFARIRGELRHRGQLIGDPDLLIAATALQHDLTLMTRNLSHFQRVPELKLYSSSSARQ